MMTLSRRKLITWTALLAGGGALVEVVRRQNEPPPAAWVRDRLWGDDLLAYAVWDGEPRAVLADGDNRVKFDLMIRGDWLWPEWPPRPQWQLAGAGYKIAASDAPATVGYAPCVGIMGEHCTQIPELFGQVNDANIVAMEVLAGGTWRRFAVLPPGFIVRLDGVTIVPSGYRWFNAAGRIVWETLASSLTTPGPRPWRRRQNRQASAPASRTNDRYADAPE